MGFLCGSAVMNLPAIQEPQEAQVRSLEGIPWRRAWQPSPRFLPGESHGQRSLVGYSPWGRRVGHDWSDLALTHSDMHTSYILTWSAKATDVMDLKCLSKSTGYWIGGSMEHRRPQVGWELTRGWEINPALHLRRLNRGGQAREGVSRVGAGMPQSGRVLGSRAGCLDFWEEEELGWCQHPFHF